MTSTTNSSYSGVLSANSPCEIPQYARSVVPAFFGTRDWFCIRQFFHKPGGDDQLHLRSSSIRSQRLGTPVLHRERQRERESETEREREGKGGWVKERKEIFHKIKLGFSDRF